MFKPVKPSKLLAGDTVAIITPSEPMPAEILLNVKDYFTKKGMNIVTGPNIGKAIGDYVAGTPAQRADDFNWAFSNPDIKAIIVGFGGMGANQILDEIDFDLVKKNPKIFCGYSDATTLQLAAFAKSNLITFHSPNVAAFPDLKQSGYTLTHFWRIVSNEISGDVIEPQSTWQVIVPGQMEGIIFGGNLSCIGKLMGTKWDPVKYSLENFSSKEKIIFFWEEVEEQYSEIIRSLWQIRNSGLFEIVSGMIVGKLTSVAETDYVQFPSKKALILEAVKSFGFPVVYGFDFGHEVPKATIPIGIRGKIDTSKLVLELLEPSVI